MRLTGIQRIKARALILLAAAVMGILGGTLYSPTAAAMGTWLFTGRNHPELRWQVIETEHFRVIYHQGLEKTARRAARIAEQVYGPVTQQMRTEMKRRTPIVITASDEIVNGYAMHTGQIFVWVRLNDFIGHFSGTDKWMRKVIAHEFQHVVTFEALKTWAGMWNLLFVPDWYMEGAAEYFTETWGVGRSDADVRAYTLRNRLGDLDAHDSGFAKVLYLAREYGDSTVALIGKHRSGALKLYSFSEAFKEVTGRSVGDFEEEWRRTMNATYYGYFGQKEGIYDVGESLPLPLDKVQGAAYSPDSSQIAVVGKRSPGMGGLGLYLVSSDSTRDVREIDFGMLDWYVSWAPGGKALTYARFHRGSHGSLTWDIYRMDLPWGKGRWLTRNQRANDPCFSPDGRNIVYVSHPDETANLYLMTVEGVPLRRITNFTGDVQLAWPRYSPDGKWIAFTVFDEESGPDVAVVGSEGGDFIKLTNDSLYDLLPMWSPKGDRIYFTSYREGTANLFSVAFPPPGEYGRRGTASPEQLTDVGEGIWGISMVPGSESILARTLPSVDSVRVVQVDGARRVEPDPLELRASFIEWQTHAPEIVIPPIDRDKPIEMSGPRSYRFWHDVRLLTWLVLPTYDGVAGMVLANDALGRHLLGVGASIDWEGEWPGINLTYMNATQAPLLGISAYRGWREGLRMYERKFLRERLSGVTLWGSLPYNRGDNLASNHTVTLSLDLRKREPRETKDFSGRDLPVPESGREGVLGLEYRWVDRRPDRRNVILPREGEGVALRWEHAYASYFGDYTYERYSCDVFANCRVPMLGPILFGRLKFEGSGGHVPAQDVVGITPDESLYLPQGSLLSGLRDGFLLSPERPRLRGWNGYWLGERVIWGTAELRVPLLGGLPVNLLGVNPGPLVGSIYFDAGSVWTTADKDARKWVSTAGVELKHQVRLGNETLFVAAWGLGQRWREWRKGRTVELEHYFRLGMVNPF